jgi:predicted RNase H-like nuclease
MGGSLTCFVTDDIAPVLDRFHFIGIDMPIGLPDGPRRSADVAARRLLGNRASTVFPALPRIALDASDHAEASARCRERHGVGVSRQAFALRGHIAALDAALRPADEERVVEIHPELSFMALAGSRSRSDDHPVPLTTKHSEDGRLARFDLATGEFGPLPTPPHGAALTDLLDAAAVLWSTERFAKGEHTTLPHHHPLERDARGRPMRIVF